MGLDGLLRQVVFGASLQGTGRASLFCAGLLSAASVELLQKQSLTHKNEKRESS